MEDITQKAKLFKEIPLVLFPRNEKLFYIFREAKDISLS